MTVPLLVTFISRDGRYTRQVTYRLAGRSPSTTVAVFVPALGSAGTNLVLVEALGNELAERQPLQAADVDKIRADRSDARLKSW